MLEQLLWALLLTAVSAALHGVYTIILARRLQSVRDHRHAKLIRGWWLLSEIVGWIVILHSAEASLWAVFYMWKGGFTHFADSLYFSIVSYATIGYGDLLLPAHLRLVGACEGMAGTLLSGWSVAIILAVIHTLLYLQEKNPLKAK